MKLGQAAGGGAAHLRDGHREQPAIEPHAARACDRLDELGGVFLAEHPRLIVGAEIKWAELLDAEAEQVKRLTG